MLRRLHLLALRSYRRSPRLVRRWVVRAIAPKYTVGSICLIERADGRVLLVRQAYRAGWGIPGGLLRRREAADAAARREVVEEVGLAIELVGQPAVVVVPGPQRVDVVFRARPVREADVRQVSPRTPEIDEVGWFSLDELPELQEETADALVALARSSRQPQAPNLVRGAGLADR